MICRVNDDIPAYIFGDPFRFRQVLVNLFGNAVKFTSAGEIELSLEVEEEKEGWLKIHIKVRDTGIGIPENQLETIFDAFRQVDGSTTREYGGSGLGLAISRQIANLMNGNVWAESSTGNGSIFHFTSWLAKSKKAPEKEVHYEHLAGRKALIIDDNQNNLEILTHILKRSKMRVVQFSRGADVVPAIEESFKNDDPFDICIIDIWMPEMSGDEVAKGIRRLAAPMSKIPLLAFSSSTTARSKRFKDAGFDGFLPKPIRRRKLIRVIERLLARKEIGIDEDEGNFVTQRTIVEEAKHSIHILLAEDNPINLKLAHYMLTKAGYQLTAVNNGLEVVNTFTSKPDRFDLIFMDIQMPKLNGIDATRIIREQGFNEIPIVAMTAQAMKGDREKCINAGMNDYVSKPIKRDIVFAMVKKWCLHDNPTPT
jgi:CheY-like chemotaxis protein/anti-sigma regulatory factor (Ser/Thr protein kinase)